MNCFAARAVWNGIAWTGEFRAASHAEFRPVQRDGKPAAFPTRAEAQMAADEALRGYINGNMRRDGEIITATLAAADALFPAFVRQKGKTRLTVVERRRA